MIPREKGLHCKRAARRAAMLADCTAHSAALPRWHCYTIWVTSTTRCRSAHLVEVQPNFRLPPVSTMRRASAMPHSVGSLPPSKRHSRLTIVRRGCKRSRLAEIHGEAMYTAPDCAARAVIRASGCQCAGSRGMAPCVLLGVQGGHSPT